MEFEYSADRIVFDRELSPLDEFTLAFTELLDKTGTGYVLMSGYVAILFGRSRSSEDVDMFLERMDYGRFEKLWHALQERFICITTDSPRDAYEEYLKDGLALRFSAPDVFIPNMEVKFPKTAIDSMSMERRLTVVLNGRTLFISPIETQIAFKVSLGSEKDFEDARHLYKVFSKHLDRDELRLAIRNLHIEQDFIKYIDDDFME